MSGPVANNVFRSSGVIASAAGGLSWQSVVTASTVTVSAGNGYPINTTSNTCTITLPSSAEAGDQIIFLDYARTWGTNKIIIDSNGLNYQGEADTYTVEYDTSGQTVSIVYSGATVGWIPESDVDVTDAPVQPPTQKAIFGYGSTGSVTAITNLVNSSGVVATDTTGVGTARQSLAAAGYGLDKAIFGYGTTGSVVSLTNLVNNSGVVAADTTGVGTARHSPAATRYGGDKAIFGYGNSGSRTAITNLVSNSGVVATDTTGVGTARQSLGATGYGGDKAIFGYGYGPGQSSITNLVSSSGVVATDTSGVGTARNGPGAAGYGSTGQAIFGYGHGRAYLGSAEYGGDKAIFAYGSTGSYVSMSNLISNTGVQGSDVTGVGSARAELKAAGYSISA